MLRITFGVCWESQDENHVNFKLSEKHPGHLQTLKYSLLMV